MKINKRYIVLSILLSVISIVYTQAHTGKMCLFPMKYVIFGTDCKWLEEELKSSKDYQVALLCEKFIQKNYPNINYPVFLKPCIDNITDPCYRISYDTQSLGGALNSDLESYEMMLKENTIFSKIGINLWFHLYDSPETILKLLEYSIKKEPILKKQHKKLRKIIKIRGNTTSQEDDTLVIEDFFLLEVISQPPSKKIISFLREYGIKDLLEGNHKISTN